MMQKLEKELQIMWSNAKIPIRIAFVDSNNEPKVISLWYVCINGKIFCATQKSAKIVKHLKENPICGFEIAADSPPYKGLRGKGIVRILENNDKKILRILMDKYLDDKESKLSQFLEDNSKTEVAIKITPKKIINYDYSQRMEGIVK